MSSFLFSLPEVYNSYKLWVSKNPQLAGDLESTAKWISYFIAGRVNNSNITSELVFSLSNLLILFNDCIIRQSKKLPKSSGNTIKIWLTILEYSEVFIEISAKKLWGERGKWFIILFLQVAKCVSRLALIVLHKEKIIQNPAVPPLKRNTLSDNKSNNDPKYNLNSMTFTLRRSGRIIRRINAAPPVQCRNWKLPVFTPENCESESLEDEDETEQHFTKKSLAEALYVVKPLVHLGALNHWGFKAWKPWFVALAIDLSSLQLYKLCEGTSTISHKERLELSRRSVALLLYILRSPFYEKYSSDRIQAFLDGLSNTVPFARLICNPISQYIPLWQRTYFYMWST